MTWTNQGRICIQSVFRSRTVVGMTSCVRQYLEQHDNIVQDSPLHVQSGTGECTTHPSTDSECAAARRAIFASALVTNPGKGSLRQNYESVGGQADLRFSILHWYDLTLSAGYAVGFRDGKRTGSEWMLSLKIF